MSTPRAPGSIRSGRYKQYRLPNGKETAFSAPRAAVELSVAGSESASVRHYGTLNGAPGSGDAVSQATIDSRQFWYGTMLGNYLAISRLFAAAVSAYSMFLATTALYISIAGTVKNDSNYQPQDIEKYTMDAVIGLICGMTFVGMASGSYYAQSFRLQSTVKELVKTGKPEYKYIETPSDVGLFVSTIAYGGLIGLSTLSSVLGLFTAWTQDLWAYIVGLTVGGIFGLGYGLLTVNYNWKNIEQWREKVRDNHVDAKASCRLWTWYLFANMTAQLALNVYLPSKGVGKMAGQDWDALYIVFPIMAYVGFTAWSNIRTQQTSFFSSFRKPGGMMGNVTRHHAGMPKSVPWNIRWISYLNRWLSNFAALMMIPGNGNALAQLVMAICNLSLNAADKPSLPLWSFLAILAGTMLIATPNCLGYLAFNTEPGKLTFDWRLLTGRILSVHEMAYFMALHALEDKIESTRALPTALLKNPLEEFLIGRADKYWEAISKKESTLLNRVLKKIETVHQSMAAEAILDYMITSALKAVLNVEKVSKEKVNLAHALLDLKEQRYAKKLTNEQKGQVQQLWELFTPESVTELDRVSKNIPTVMQGRKFNADSLLANLSAILNDSSSPASTLHVEIPMPGPTPLYDHGKEEKSSPDSSRGFMSPVGVATPYPDHV